MSDRDLDVIPDLDEDSSLYHKDLPILKQKLSFKNDKALKEEAGGTDWEVEEAGFLEAGTVELGEGGELELVLGAGKRGREEDGGGEGVKRTRASENQEETEDCGEGDSESGLELSSSSTVILAQQSSPVLVDSFPAPVDSFPALVDSFPDLVDSFPDLDSLDAGSTGEEGSQEVRESEPDLVVYSERTSSEADTLAGRPDTRTLGREKLSPTRPSGPS